MPVWRGKVFLNSLGPLAGSENYNDKDRWAGEKHTYLFKFHVTWEPPQGHEHPKKHFDAECGEGQAVVEDGGGQGG